VAAGCLSAIGAIALTIVVARVAHVGDAVGILAILAGGLAAGLGAFSGRRIALPKDVKPESAKLGFSTVQDLFCKNWAVGEKPPGVA
jgi:hypothetical protein